MAWTDPQAERDPTLLLEHKQLQLSQARLDALPTVSDFAGDFAPFLQRNFPQKKGS